MVVASNISSTTTMFWRPVLVNLQNHTAITPQVYEGARILSGCERKKHFRIGVAMSMYCEFSLYRNALLCCILEELSILPGRSFANMYNLAILFSSS